jgi:hypothetical protein
MQRVIPDTSMLEHGVPVGDLLQREPWLRNVVARAKRIALGLPLHRIHLYLFDPDQ